MWVLSRMKIRVHRYPVWDEMVSVETWHRGMERIFGMRDFRIRDAAGEALAVASSAWLIVDMESRRPVRPDDSILQDNRGEESVFGTHLGKIELPDEPELLASHPVVYSDLDIVGHVNNVKFIEWCIDAAVPATYNGAGIREFEINYLHEALPGDQVEIHGTEKDNGDSYFVALKNGAKQEIFRARIAWS
jgi:acyl-ACP thioesterase